MPNINPIVLKTVSGGGGINYTVDVFTSSGTYTKPANLDYAYVLMVSGGCGGGSGRRGAADSNRGAGSGSHGQCILFKFTNSDLDTTESVTVGSGSPGAQGITTNDTNGLFPSGSGATSFNNFSVGGMSGNNGLTFIRPVASGGKSGPIIPDKSKIILGMVERNSCGTTLPNDTTRGNVLTFGGNFGIFCGDSIGGQINSSNTQFNAGNLSGFYNDSNVLTGEMTGTLPEGGNGVQPTEFYTFGQFLSKLFPWFDPADANYNIGRGGLGGGCGDTAGTVAGGNGADALGYGGGGGGGGASTNGANSGAGGAGSQGIVIIINVLTS